MNLFFLHKSLNYLKDFSTEILYWLKKYLQPIIPLKTTYALIIIFSLLLSNKVKGQTIFSENFEGTVTGWTGFISACTGNNGNYWHMGAKTGASASPNILTFIGVETCTGGGVLTGTYSPRISRIDASCNYYCYYANVNTSKRLYTPFINASGYTNLILTFNYEIGGELTSGTYYDYGTLQYSTDGTTWTTLENYYQGVTTKTAKTVNLPAALNGASFYLAWLFKCDNGTRSEPSFTFDDVVVTGTLTSSCTTPTTYTVTGGGSYCSGGGGVAIGLSGSQSGVTYQLYRGATPVGGTVAGTGSALNFGNQTTAGTYTVQTTTADGYCAITMTGSAIVTVNSVPGAPSTATHTPSETQIIWDWNTVASAIGYKWNTTNNYSTAADLGNISTYTQTVLTCNTAYNLYVWAYNACGYSGVTTLSATTPVCAPANDACANATSLLCGTTDLAGTTVGCVNETSPGCGSNYGVWYTFTGDGNQTTITVQNVSLDTEFGLYSGSCGSIEEITCEDAYYSSDPEEYTFTTTNGVTYYVYVAYYDESGSTTGDFTISRTCATNPCTSITNITDCGSSYSQTYNNSGTGTWFTSSDNDCGFYSEGIEEIYSFTPIASGNYNIVVTAASGEYIDYLYQASSCALTGWTCIEDIDSPGTSSSFSLTAGITYYFLLDPEGTSATSQTFYINCPGVNPCPLATTMECGNEYTATLEPGNSYWTIYTDNEYNDYTGSEKVWVFTAPTTGTYTFDLNEGDNDADFILMSDCDNTSDNLSYDLTSEEYWDGVGTYDVDLTLGTTYYLIADLYEDESSTTVTVSVTCPTDPCTSVTSIDGCGSDNAQTASLSGSSSWNGTYCGYSGSGAEKVYSFQAPYTGTYSIEVTLSDGYSVEYGWSTSCASTGWTCIDEIYSTGTYGAMSWTAGTTYYIVLDKYSTGSCSQTFYINCPGVDPCPLATTMECGNEYTATLEPGNSYWTIYTDNEYNDYTGSEKVWVFTAPTTGTYTFDLNEGDNDADFILMSDCDNTSDNLSYDLTSEEYWDGVGTYDVDLTLGTTYYLIADLYEDESSTTVTVSVACPTDPCISATTMECGTDYTATLTTGNSSWLTYTDNQYEYDGSEKIWVFTAPTTGTYTFDLDEGSYDADFMLMSDCDNTSTNLTGTNYWAGVGTYDVDLTQGITYYLIADLYSSSSTTVTVSVTCPVPCITPGTPVSLNGSGSSGTTAILSWSPGTPAGSNDVIYFWEIFTSGGVSVTSGNTLNTTATAGGLTCNTAYYFEVYAQTSCNETYSSTATSLQFSTSACCNISNLNFTGQDIPDLESDGIYYFYVCQGTTLNVNATATCDNCVTTPDYTWIINAYDGTGPQPHNNPLSYSVSTATGYDGMLVIEGESCRSDIPFRICSSSGPAINSISATIAGCAGSLATVEVGGTGTDIEVAGYESEFTSTMGVGETTFIPDGPNCLSLGLCYESSVTFTDFPINSIITSAEDILYLKINMEHTFIGDVQISLEGPDDCGSAIILQDYFNLSEDGVDDYSYNWPFMVGTDYGRIGFGDPVSSDLVNSSDPCDILDVDNAPGYGWDYCWSDNPDYGYAPGNSYVYEIVNMTDYGSGSPWYQPRYIVNASDLTDNTNFYHPFQSFEGLVGCPLNGTWTVKVCDSWELDNGWIFNWELALDADLLPSAWSYDAGIDHVDWNLTDFTPVLISGTGVFPLEYNLVPDPDLNGPQTGTFTVVDEYGCSTTDNISVNVTGLPTITGADVGDFVWTGYANTNWNSISNGNWIEKTLSQGYEIASSVPDNSTDVFIIANCGNSGATVIEDVSCKDLTIVSGTLTMADNINLNVYGNWTNNSTFTSGSGTVNFKGSSSQSVGGSSATSFYNLTVDNSGNGLTISTTPSVSNVLTLTDGKVTTGANRIDVTNSATNSVVQGSGNPGYNNSWINGTLRRYVAGGGPLTYDIPVGTNMLPFLAQIQSTGFTYTYLDSKFNNPITTTGGTLNPALAVDFTTPYSSVHAAGEWQVDPAGTAGGTYDFYGYTANFSGLTDNTFAILKRSSSSTSNSDWVGEGAGSLNANGGLGRMVADGFALRKGMSGFSKFGIGIANNPLPVELTYFNAICENLKVDLNWSTATENNNDYFTIERSSDASEWEFVKSVPGGGNSNIMLNYSATDNEPFNGISFYRLKQTDYDGQTEIFSPVAVNCESSAGDAQINYYPNPFTSEIMVDLRNVNADNAVFIIYDALGKKVFEKDIDNVQIETQKVILDLGMLTKGVYSVQFNSTTFSTTSKIVKN